MGKLNVTLVKSTNKATKSQKATVAALGLKKIGQTVEKNDDAAIRGMVQKAANYVTFEEV